MPWSAPGRRPAYCIAGGLVFRELDRNYLTAWGKDWRQEAEARLVTSYELERHAQEPGRRRIVILSSVLPSAYNLGYHRLRDLAVRAVNGTTIGSLADLVEAFRHPTAGFHTISFAPNAQLDEAVLAAAEMESADEAILRNYRIPAASYLAPQPPPDLGPLPLAAP